MANVYVGAHFHKNQMMHWSFDGSCDCRDMCPLVIVIVRMSSDMCPLVIDIVSSRRKAICWSLHDLCFMCIYTPYADRRSVDLIC